MKQNIRSLFGHILRNAGLEYVRTPHRSFIVKEGNLYFPILRRKRIFFNLDIEVLYDIGAQIGGWSLYLRHRGYKGRIVCFEPNPLSYEILQKSSKKYRNWFNYNCAIGGDECVGKLKVIGHLGESSSLLDPADSRLRVNNIINVKVDPLSKYFASHGIKHSFVKIDAQGYEYNILKGIEKEINEISGIHLEVSLQRDYVGEHTFEELHRLLINNEFTLVNVEPGYTEPKTAIMREMNCLYVNNSIVNSLH